MDGLLPRFVLNLDGFWSDFPQKKPEFRTSKWKKNLHGNPQTFNFRGYKPTFLGLKTFMFHGFWGPKAAENFVIL